MPVREINFSNLIKCTESSTNNSLWTLKGKFCCPMHEYNGIHNALIKSDVLLSNMECKKKKAFFPIE